MRPGIPASLEPSLSIEDQVLLCVAHPCFSHERRGRLTHLLASPLDWRELLEQADRHRMVPFLYHHLQGGPHKGAPASALAALAHRSREHLIWNVLLNRELIRLLGEFNRGGIPVMPLKGPLLADLLYGDFSLRPMGDIDLLIRREDLAKGEQILLRAGCIRWPAAEEGADYHNSYATEGERGARIVVDLHWDLADSHVTRLDVREIWASASRIAWEGREVWTMTLPDLLLYLCLHAVKDGLGSLRPLLDIALVVERFGGILPWKELVEKARAARIGTPVYASLLQSQVFLGAQVPLEVFSALRPSRRIGWLLAQAMFRWRGGTLHTSPDLLVGPIMAVLHLLWEDSLRGKLRHLRRHLFPSARLRARWTSFPPCTSILRWYPIRLWQACGHLTRQLAARSRSGQGGPRQGRPSCTSGPTVGTH